MHAPTLPRWACLYRAAEQLDSLPHPDQANARTIGLGRGHHAALIHNGCLPPVRVVAQLNINASSARGVTQYIGEGLLNHPVEGEPQAGIRRQLE
jgi:hypothetical protein